jgi:hypothetical protein
MQRSYICKKIGEIINCVQLSERQEKLDALERYISRKKISTTSVETAAKDIVLAKISDYVKHPNVQNRTELTKLLGYLQEGLDA